MDLRIELEQASRTYPAGETVRGVVRFRAAQPGTARLKVALRWRTHGRADVEEGPDQGRWLLDGAFPAGEQGHPFALRLPAVPVTYRGQFVNLDWYLGATLKRRGRRDEEVEEDLLVVASPATAAFYEAESLPARPGAHAHMGSGLTCAGILLAIAGGLSLLPDPGVVTVLSLCAVLAAGVTAFLAVRNYLAETRLGEVFVGLAGRVRAGEELPLTMRFRPRTDVTLNAITATLVGTERASSGSGSDRTSVERRLFHKPLRLRGSGGVSAGQLLAVEERFQLPETAAPTLELEDSRVTWQVELRIDIAGWPDWVHEIPLRVEPVPPRPEPIRLRAPFAPGVRCAYCRDELAGATVSQTVTCAGCRVVLHRECLDELGSCPTPGCRYRARGRRRRRARRG